MFQFTSFAFQPYIFRLEYLQSRWVSSFGDLWIKAYLPAPHSFSQAVTSFIACDRQGIHHIHLVAWSYNPEAFCPQSHKQPITYTLISLIMSVLENFNESMNAITTLSSFIRHHLITTTLHELNASFLSKLLKSSRFLFIKKAAPYAKNRFLNRLRTALCEWWVWMVSNHRPPPYQDGALTNWATDPPQREVKNHSTTR